MHVDTTRAYAPDDDSGTPQLEFVNRSPDEQLAAAIADVRMHRRRVDTARLQLRDSALDLERSLKRAHRLGASVRQLEEPSGLHKSHIHDLVSRD